MWTVALRSEINGIHSVAHLATRGLTQDGNPVAGCAIEQDAVCPWVCRSVNTSAGKDASKAVGSRVHGEVLMWGVLISKPPGPGTMWFLASVRKSSDFCWKEEATVPVFQGPNGGRTSCMNGTLLDAVSGGYQMGHIASTLQLVASKILTSFRE
ncbi:hypothetical protein B0H17DRAFT_1140770 [Mycena rosella]|uniref:Uncharacterized protein n=1 Tax=Mycena rosella TaxID=1033263 RepID=A0AAD7D1P2_MYCRO|nr:hypothetical protein B0H17DRAFT_1140770 [Mycena rosella]